MLQSQVSILTVNSSTAQVGAFLTCTNCSGLTIADIVMKVYRKGVAYLCNNNIPTPQQYPNCAQPPNNANGPCPVPYYPNVPPAPTYFLTYPAYSLTGNVVTFFIDSRLTTMCPGRYVGDVFINGLGCGSIEMEVGDDCETLMPYTVPINNSLGGDLQPS